MGMDAKEPGGVPWVPSDKFRSSILIPLGFGNR
jgi:hypothetical protein